MSGQDSYESGSLVSQEDFWPAKQPSSQVFSTIVHTLNFPSFSAGKLIMSLNLKSQLNTLTNHLSKKFP